MIWFWLLSQMEFACLQNRGNRSFFEITQSENAFAGDGPISDMSLIDLDRDLDLDVVTVHRGSGKVGMLENLLHLQFRSRFFDEIPPMDGAEFITVEDIDGNVSWDLVVAGKGRRFHCFLADRCRECMDCRSCGAQ